MFLGQCVIPPLSFALHSHDSDICIMTSIKLNSLSKYKICANIAHFIIQIMDFCHLWGQKHMMDKAASVFLHLLKITSVPD